jgi:hypothetical protein
MAERLEDIQRLINARTKELETETDKDRCKSMLDELEQLKESSVLMQQEGWYFGA